MTKLSEMIYEKEFKSTKTGGIFGGEAGYEAARVDLFLEEIAPLAERLEKENEMLLEKVREFEAMAVHQQMTTMELGETEETSTGIEQFEIDSSQDENLKRSWRQVEMIERSYRKILFAAEEESEEITRVAKEEAKKLLFATQQKAELLLKQVNIRCEEKEKHLEQLKEKEDSVQRELLKIADYIHQTTKVEQA